MTLLLVLFCFLIQYYQTIYSRVHDPNSKFYCEVRPWGCSQPHLDAIPKINHRKRPTNYLFNKVLCKCQNVLSSRTKYRIINGEEVTQQDLKFVAVVFWKFAMYPFPSIGEDINQIFLRTMCGAVIINPTFVLTAGHCVIPKEQDSEGFDFFVGAGLDHRTLSLWTKEDNYRKIINQYPNPHFELRKLDPVISPTYQPGQIAPFNDIALLELEKPFEFNEKTNIQPACFTNTFLDWNHIKNSELITVGYGYIDPTPMEQDEHMDYHPSFRLMMFKTRQVGTEEAPIRNYNSSTHGHAIFTRSSTSATCMADSGAPLLYWNNRSLVVVGVLHGSSQRYNKVYKKLDNTYDQVTCYPNETDFYFTVCDSLKWMRYKFVGDNMCLD